MAKSTSRKSSRKPARPEKPYEGYPLFAHPSGQWAKKIRGRLVYFGSWRSDPKGAAALETFNREWPYLADGRTPPPPDLADGCTLRTLCDKFVGAKEDQLECGELSPRSFRDYYQTCKSLIDHFGRDQRVDDLRPDDFRSFRKLLAKRLGVVSLKNEINRCHIVLNFAHANKLIGEPVSFGQHFDRPSAKALRKARNKAGSRMLEAAEVRQILDAADPTMRAMVLLAVNCGFGNTDVANLPRSAIDFATGWVSFPRPKTEIPRRIPLWPETVAALKIALELRPKPADRTHDGLCFLTRLGAPWVRVKPKTADDSERDEPDVNKLVPIDALSPQFGKLLRSLKINGRRGMGFYGGRHVTQTIGGEAKDPDAVSAIMGHVDNSMGSVYRERISDERLRAVTETIRRWVFGAEGGER